MRRPLVLCIFLSSFMCAGCGGSDGPERYAVSGKVTLDGQPLDSGHIQFEPQGEPNISGGAVIKEGQYAIPEDQGLPVGKYRIRIFSAGGEAPPVEEAPGEAPPMEERIPPEFNATSEKFVEVTADGANTFDFSIP